MTKITSSKNTVLFFTLVVIGGLINLYLAVMAYRYSEPLLWGCAVACAAYIVWGLQGVCWYEVTPEEIIRYSPYGKTTIKWSEIKQAYMVSCSVARYLDRVECVILTTQPEGKKIGYKASTFLWNRKKHIGIGIVNSTVKKAAQYAYVPNFERQMLCDYLAAKGIQLECKG